MKRKRLHLEIIRMGVQTLWAQKLRSSLTLLGMICGVAAVMVVGAGIEGFETYIVDTFQKVLGGDSFVLDRFPAGMTRSQFREASRRNPRLTIEDLEFLRERCTLCGQMIGAAQTTRPVYQGNREIFGTNVLGISAEWIIMSGAVDVETGRFFTKNEVRRKKPVAAIGTDLRDELFPNTDPLGKNVKIAGHRFRVIGVLEKQGSLLGASQDNVIYIPISAYRKVFGRRRSLSIRGHAAEGVEFERMMDQVHLAMRLRHKLGPGEEDDFGLTSSLEINEFIGQASNFVQMVIVPVIFISLVVGAIVIMNIMLVSVTERTFEIGLRKSVGARGRDILAQVFAESLLLALLGGTIGILTAYAAVFAVQRMTGAPMTVSWVYLALSIGTSGGIGILAGLYPAWRAARLDPIVALSAER